jgi:hypothetical protein
MSGMLGAALDNVRFGGGGRLDAVQQFGASLCKLGEMQRRRVTAGPPTRIRSLSSERSWIAAPRASARSLAMPLDKTCAAAMALDPPHPR